VAPSAFQKFLYDQSTFCRKNVAAWRSNFSKVQALRQRLVRCTSTVRRLAGAETERFLAKALVGFSSNPFLSTRIMQGSKSWPPQDAYDHLAYLCATDKRTAKAFANRALRGSTGKSTATG
jgi:hypothetical protein